MAALDGVLKDGITLMVGGFGLCGVPQNLCVALRDSGVTDLTCTVSLEDLPAALNLVEPVAKSIGARGVEANDGLAKVTVVGAAMRNSPGFAARTFEALFHAGVNIEMVTTSEIRISAIVSRDAVADAVTALHRAFGLEQLDGTP